MNIKKIGYILLTILIIMSALIAADNYRVGTTTANFLEMGFGSDGIAMGDAGVSIPGRSSSIYWNPAGLAFLKNNTASFMNQPWLVGINMNAVSASYVVPVIGVISVGIFHMDYGEMDVTTLEMQEGTGEKFSANEYCASFTYSRKLAQWFAFGASAKYISSQIWHESASAMALDLGVLVNTHFFTFTGNEEDGLKIGMSISNYGTKMQYGGMDLIFPIDIAQNENGNFEDAPGQLRTEAWELPLIFRIGASFSPISTTFNKITLAADALHPNNNSESVNLGAEYELNIPGTGSLFLRGGYKGLFMHNSEYGLTFGGGILLRLMGNMGLQVDYAFRNLGVLGNTNTYTVGLNF